MKTIVETSTNLSKYLLNDDEIVIATDDHIVVGDPVKFFIADLNQKNAIVYEGVNAPADWFGNKYTFDGNEWSISPNWIEPELA